MSDRVLLSRTGQILIMAMNRPAKRNAIDRGLADALDAALDLLENDPDLWVGILTGSETIFSAGSDFTVNGDYVTKLGGEYGVIRRRRRKPLIAAVEGPALGGGFEITLACDLVVSSTTAVFGLPEVTRGVVPTCAGLFRAPSSLPTNMAREMILTGDSVSAERAYLAGFVNLLTEPGDAVAGAIGLAKRICKNSPRAVQESVVALNGYMQLDEEQGWALTGNALASIRNTEDFKEGISAFFEHRSPVWTGH